jgi:hypothetical protein
MTMEAVPSQSIGSYGERPAALFLSRIFAATWVHRVPEAAPASIAISPDATIDLQWIDGRFRIAGPDREQQIERLPAGATVVGFRFQPGAAAAWLGVPANEILGARTPLSDVVGGKARLTASVRPGPLAELVVSLENAIARYSVERQETDHTMEAAFRLIDRGPPPARGAAGALALPRAGDERAHAEAALRRKLRLRPENA